ncbi:TIGR03668 family PPOX class F420-dependent oxidoreductase [Streptomyces sp. NPDC003697]
MPRMDPDRARRRFSAARVARLATVDAAGRPHLVPVVFAALGDDRVVMVVDRKPKTTTELKRLHNIAVHPAVCLLVDGYDEDWDRLWWVRADGGARIVPADARDAATRQEYEDVVARLRRKYPHYRTDAPHGPAVVITVHRWSGWHAVPSATEAPAG